MANQNPTGDGDAVALTIPAEHRKFLRETFEIARAGVRDELAEHPGSPSRAETLRREETAYGQLLAGLDGQAIVPNDDACDVLSDLAGIIDRGNEYRRVVQEHDALHDLLRQLVGGESR